MELGDEWVVDDVLNTLCSGRAAPEQIDLNRRYWIDQLCIAQDDLAQVRETLAKVPQIFGKLDVTILMPGQACECWRSLPDRPSLAADDECNHEGSWGALCVNLAGLRG